MADALPTVFPLEEEVGFYDDSMTPISSPPWGTKTATLATIDGRMTRAVFV